VDATFLAVRDRACLRQLAWQHQLPWAILHCHAPQPVLHERILARQVQGGDPSEADLAVLAGQTQAGDALLTGEQGEVLDVDASRPWSAAELVRRWLGMPPPDEVSR
jgi:predicted kinase